MKGKIAIGLCLSAICADAFAADELANAYFDICKSEGSIVLVLHKDIDGTLTGTDGNQWTVELPYDVLTGGEPYSGKTSTINGIAACSNISVKSAPDGSGFDGGAIEPGDVNTFAVMTDASAGKKCWCRIAGPTITSYWTYVYEYASDDECATNCPAYCGNGFATNTNSPAMTNGRKVRDAIIDGVW